MSFSDVRLEDEDCKVGMVGDHTLKCSRSRKLAADLRLRNVYFEQVDEK